MQPKCRTAPPKCQIVPPSLRAVEQLERFFAAGNIAVTGVNKMTSVSNKEVYLARHPFDRNVFVMMKYSRDTYHSLIEANVRRAFRDVEFYHPIFAKDLTPAYFPTLAEALESSVAMCRYGVAIFTSQAGTEFNPNVAFEMGIMREQKKDVLILKDHSVATLFTDIMGTVYEEFDGALDELRVEGNQLYTALRKWLELKEEIQLASIDVIFMTDIEQMMGMLDDPNKAAVYFEAQLWKCVETVAKYARLTLPPSNDLRKLIRFLYDKRQLTSFIYSVMRKGFAACQHLKSAKQLSHEERTRFLALAALHRDVYNDWLRHYGYYLRFIKMQ